LRALRAISLGVPPTASALNDLLAGCARRGILDGRRDGTLYFCESGILDLMLPDCRGDTKPQQQALAPNDVAYLKALYAADLGATTKSVQKTSIAGGIEDDLGEPPQR